MSILESIEIREVPTPGPNLNPVLHEIRHALEALYANGAVQVIDLQGMPFGPGEEEALLELLGIGEVRATIDALGETRIHESGYPGVWVVDHRNAVGERIAFQIEITDAPSILRTQREDLADSARRLTEVLQGDEPDHNLDP